MSTDSPPVLYYDGECGVCSRSVRFVLRHDRRRTLHFASLRGAHADALRSRHPGLDAVDSMLWVEPPAAGRPEEVLLRSDAALAVARYLGGGWSLLGWLRAIPHRWRDAGYDWIARNRSRLGSAADACGVPSPADRERFLDLE